MNQNSTNALAFFFIGVIGITSAVSGIIQAKEIADLKKHPTYHCDGSATVGYAVPGTPEAAACWIEGGEK